MCRVLVLKVAGQSPLRGYIVARGNKKASTTDSEMMFIAINVYAAAMSCLSALCCGPRRRLVQSTERRCERTSSQFTPIRTQLRHGR